MSNPITKKLMVLLRQLYGGRNGAAAVEFAITAPVMVVLVLGIGDYGALMNTTASLEGATRAVAEFARNSPYCVGGGLTDSNCVSGINNLVTTLKTNGIIASATFAPSAISATPGNYCTCTDGTVVSCSGGICNVAGDIRVLQYIRVTATQSMIPIVSYGTFTAAMTLNAQTTTRIQ
jgi:Flp pilus assembly protein TadG